MAHPNDSAFNPAEAETNRGREQGLGVGQREMDAQRDPGRSETATNPEQRSFDGDLHDPDNGERHRAGEGQSGGMPDRNAAGIGDVAGDLGAGTPANVDIHKLGQADHPEQEWGEAAGEGATYSANHTRRGEPTEAMRGQGAKTRTANKDIVSRRS